MGGKFEIWGVWEVILGKVRIENGFLVFILRRFLGEREEEKK